MEHRIVGFIVKTRTPVLDVHVRDFDGLTEAAGGVLCEQKFAEVYSFDHRREDYE